MIYRFVEISPHKVAPVLGAKAMHEDNFHIQLKSRVYFDL